MQTGLTAGILVRNMRKPTTFTLWRGNNGSEWKPSRIKCMELEMTTYSEWASVDGTFCTMDVRTFGDCSGGVHEVCEIRNSFQKLEVANAHLP
jgi:hypothetical protein